ncbi:hypothetical protein GCM10027174_00320 [Salinifilum aidingensis]
MSARAQRQLSLSPEAVHYLCERFDLRLHPMLRVGWLPVGATEDDQRELARRGHDELARQGLLDEGDPHPFVDDALHLLAKPPLAVALAARVPGGEDFNAVLVEHGRDTIQAYQPDGENAEQVREIRLSRHEFGGPARNAVDLLGGVGAASGGSVSLPTEQLDRVGSGRGSGGLLPALRSAGIAGSDAQVLVKALTGERTMDGVFTARAYDRKLRRVRKLGSNLQFFTTTEGTYFLRRKTGGDGREWCTIAPADNRKLVSQLEEMAKELTAQSARA